jgi:hypothetical protein
MVFQIRSVWRFPWLLLLSLLGSQCSPAMAVPIYVTYTDAAGEGFYDANLGTPRRNAFEAAAAQWSRTLPGTVPVRVRASFNPLTSSEGYVTLGAAAPLEYFVNWVPSPPVANTAYPVALANQLAGFDLSPGGMDIVAEFNSDIDSASSSIGNFYYGLDMQAGVNIDFYRVALHELGHGLGFTDFLRQDGSYITPYPGIYDRHLATGAVATAPLLINLSQSQRAAALVSQSLYFSGPNTRAAHNNINAVLYAPTPFESGSSVSHLNEINFSPPPDGIASSANDELMTPIRTGNTHTIGPVLLGIMRDLGWFNPIPALPTAVLEQPATNGLFVNGVYRILGRATAPGGLKQTQLLLDGADLGAVRTPRPDGKPGFYLDWNTTTVSVGVHTLKLRVVDLRNRIAEVSRTVVVDNAAPTTTAGLGALTGNAGWLRSDVTITLSATDNPGGGGVSYTEYRVNGGAIQRYAGPFVVGIEAADILVEFRSVDKLGNTENFQSVRFKVDKTPPTTSATLSGTQGKQQWFRSNVVVTLAASDNLSGVDYTEYRVDGGAWVRYVGPFTISAESIKGADGNLINNLVEFRSVDIAGNTEPIKQQRVKIDRTPPFTTGSAIGPRDINGLFRGDVTVKLVATDALSGPDYSQRTLMNGAWSAADFWTPERRSVDFLITGNGVTRFLYRSADLAGNVEAARDSGPVIINQYVLFSNGANTSLRIVSNTAAIVNGVPHSNGSAAVKYNTEVRVRGGALETVGGAASNEIVDNNPAQTELTLLTGVPSVPMLDYPISFYERIADVVFPSTLYLDSSTRTLNGVIYVKGDIVMRATKLTGTVALVATGSILDETTSQTLLTADPFNGMLRYAGKDITLRTTVQRGLGLMYAPRGTIRVGSTDFALNGSLVANEIEILASTKFNILYDAGFAPGTYPLPIADVKVVPPAPTAPKPARPTAPTLLSPANGKIGAPLSTLLIWNEVAGALGYQVQAATDSSFAAGTVLADVSCLAPSLFVTLPKGTKCFWRVRGINQGGLGTWSAVWNFTTTDPTAPAPAIASFAPTSGAAGTTLVITGTNLSNVTGVKVGSAEAPFTIVSQTQISAVVPVAALTGRIVLTTATNTVSSAANFTVLPKITGVTPAFGAPFEPVTISGSGFPAGAGAVGVKFNGVAVTGVPTVTPTSISTFVPSTATTGKVSVTASGVTVYSPQEFIVAPRIDSFAPLEGPVGTTVTISGANFTGATKVMFNTAAATAFTVSSPTRIVATVPTGATTGPVSVTTPAGTASGRGSFFVR